MQSWLFNPSLFQSEHRRMQAFNVYSVSTLKSRTFPPPDAASAPLGQSTPHSNVYIDPSDPASVVSFDRGQGFAAMPTVPDVTGPEDVADAVSVDGEAGLLGSALLSLL
jgi:hypothetical protein